MSWKQVIGLGVVTGIVLGTCIFIYLSAVGHMVERETETSNYEVIK